MADRPTMGYLPLFFFIIMDIKTFRKIKNYYTKLYEEPTVIVDVDTYDQPVIVVTHGDGKSWAYTAKEYERCDIPLIYDAKPLAAYICLGRSNQVTQELQTYSDKFDIIYSKPKYVIVSKKERIVNAFNAIFPQIGRLYSGFIDFIRFTLGINVEILTQIIELVKDEVERRIDTNYFDCISYFVYRILINSDIENCLQPTSLKEITKTPLVYVKAYILSKRLMIRGFNSFKELIPYYSREEFKKYSEILLDNRLHLQHAKNKRIVEFIYHVTRIDDIFYKNLYIDYLYMRTIVPSEETRNFRLIPKDKHDLVYLHDKIMETHRHYLTSRQKEQLIIVNKNYHDYYYDKAKAFEYENDNYVIKACDELSELITEGETLHHCVGSYTDSVSQGHEYILFLRKKESLNVPYFTIDLTPDKRVRQIHGLCNCNINKEIKPFIDEWIEKFDLDGSNYSGCLCAL